MVKKRVNNPHSLNRMVKQNMQEASLVIARQFQHAWKHFLETRGLHNRMLALCEVYIKLTVVILLGENRNQITDPPSPIHVQLATTLYMQTLDKLQTMYHQVLFCFQN